MKQLQVILKRFNRKLVKLDNENRLKELFFRLSSAGVSLEIVYDIGAYRGDWTKEVRGYLPNSQFILFEPNVIHETFLREVDSNYHLMLLGKKNERRRFFSHAGTGDSIFPEYDETLKKRNEFRWMQVVTLDSLVGVDSRFPQPSVLKLDVQGAELEVLMGGEETLSKSSVVILECPIVHYNWGSPNIQDYLDFMFRRRFVPFFVTEIHRLCQIFVQIDIAFVREDIFDTKIKNLSDVGFWESNRMKYSKF
jgi:FkbM family methyltransferase